MGKKCLRSIKFNIHQNRLHQRRLARLFPRDNVSRSFFSLDVRRFWSNRIFHLIHINIIRELIRLIVNNSIRWKSVWEIFSIKRETGYRESNILNIKFLYELLKYIFEATLICNIF